jgi:hypothetical protein
VLDIFVVRLPQLAKTSPGGVSVQRHSCDVPVAPTKAIGQARYAVPPSDKPRAGTERPESPAFISSAGRERPQADSHKHMQRDGMRPSC